MKFFQLAPTYREEARALISLMERYDWNTFSLILDPLLPGKDELIDEFEAHGDEQPNWSVIIFVIIFDEFISSKKTSCNRIHLKGQKK